MSSVFGTGQSTNFMARMMKANQMSKVCASSHEYPHVEKNQESSWTEFQEGSKGGSWSRFMENKMVHSQFAENKIGISRFTGKKVYRYSLKIYV